MQGNQLGATYDVRECDGQEPTVGTAIGVGLDPETFSSLYQNAYPKLVVIAAALLHDRSEACDIVQQSAVVAIERIEQFKPSHGNTREIEFARWMAAIVRNVSANVRRKKKIRRTVSLNNDLEASRTRSEKGAEHANQAGVGFDPSSRTFLGMSEAFDDQLLGALQNLSEISHICLLLNVVLHLTLEEIGQLLELPPGTVASHVSRAKKSLRDQLHDYRGPAT